MDKCSRRSFQPTPVKSLSSLSGYDDDANKYHQQQHQQQRQQHPSSLVLDSRDSPHPALDGVDVQNNSRNNKNCRNDNKEDSIPSKQSYYPTDSEFINGNLDREFTKKDGVKKKKIVKIEGGSNYVVTKKMIKIEEESDDNDNEDDNQSEDEESQTKEFDNNDNNNNNNTNNTNTACEIPTLESYTPLPPSYTKANAIPFFELCKRLESLWNLRYTKRTISKKEKLKYLIPDHLHTYLDGGSPYPYLRLILCDHDSSRAHTGLKEAKIATTWAGAMGLTKGSGSGGGGSKYYARLVGFNNPNLVKDKNSVGDLSCVVRDVVMERYYNNTATKAMKGSKLTVGEVNEWLDLLVDIVKDRFGMPTTTAAAAAANGEHGVNKSTWRKGLEKAMSSQKSAKKQDKYVTLVEKLFSRNLSPVEHKFIVRILLQDIRVGINLKAILGYISPHAIEIYNSFNNLNDTCTRLSDPKYVRLLEATVEANSREIMETNRNIWMTPSTLPAVIQKTISPMLSRRTSFDTFLKEVAFRHAQLSKALPPASPAKSCLAIQHPAFLVDIKMDGERDLIHVHRGVVTVQTRNGTWYSPLYSPAIGPSIRAAIAGYDVDVILDGEMLAWDGKEDKPIPFGSNRAVAEMVRNRRMREGTLDTRDLDMHRGETDINVMTISKHKSLNSSFSTSKDLEDREDNDYWMQYVVFDILYLDGPGAKDLISKSKHLFAKDEPLHTGSLINMDCMQRKSILYNLIQPQEKVVEHIKSVVVRSDGSTMDAADYFLGNCNLEYGKTPCEFDSVYLAMCDKSGTTKFDSQRMCGKTHEEIEMERSLALEQLYKEIVDSGGQEGLIFKDLASPYYLGVKSRSMGYWWKLKPDYNETSGASDIDLLVLGGRYAVGYGRRGMVGSLILGCLGDEDYYGGDGAKYMALTKVNFNKTPENVLLENTGYQRSDENGNLQMGKWFQSEELPNFLSSRSYQRGPAGDENGWKPEKKDRPDIWIKPEDSFVVTINAGEFQTSGSMQAGYTLRFPRISKYRGKASEDPKHPDEVAHWGELNTMFEEQEENRQDEVAFGSQSEQRTSRFLTAKQLQSSGKVLAAKKSRKQTNEVKQFHIPDAGAPLSSVLDGFRFSVQPGNYRLRNDAFAATEAEENGWAIEAKTVKDRLDVIRYIQSHGGTCELTVHQKTDFLLGGTSTDAKVSNLHTLMANTDVTRTTKKDAEARRLIEMGGILKWTFVYSIVSKFLKDLDDDASGYEKSIKKDWPSLAHPRRSDFLVMSDNAKTTLQATEDEYGLRINEIASPIDFDRALEEVGRQKSKKKGGKVPMTSVPWQTNALKNVPDHERWIFRGKAQKLWPHDGEHTDADDSMCILYPDLFTDLGLEEEKEAKNIALDVGESPRWKDAMESKSLGNVAAALPLAKALGVIVTPHLHGGVTHVLCDLNRHTMLEWSSMRPLSIFSDADSGSRLHERLISLEESSALDGAGDRSVLLVSPDWLEEKWERGNE